MFLFLPEQDSDGVDNVVGMAGLSQRDLVLSQRAEAQLEQQKRDQELARRLQGQLELGSYSCNKILLKSVHFKKTVARISILSKLWYFLF